MWRVVAHSPGYPDCRFVFSTALPSSLAVRLLVTRALAEGFDILSAVSWLTKHTSGFRVILKLLVGMWGGSW